MRLLTTDLCNDGPIRHGDMLVATAVSGANILRDFREAITNTFGGRMKRYETLLDATIERALATLSEKASNRGYDGVVGIKISHPVITDGSIEVVVCGTGFWFAQRGSDS